MKWIVVSRLCSRIGALPLKDDERGGVVGDHEVVVSKLRLVDLPSGLGCGFDFGTTEVSVAMVDKSSISEAILPGLDAYTAVPVLRIGSHQVCLSDLSALVIDDKTCKSTCCQKYKRNDVKSLYAFCKFLGDKNTANARKLLSTS